MQKEISIQGIQRNNPDNKTPDGTCQELINLRYDSGAWRPVAYKKRVDGSTTQESFFVHDVGTVKNLISKFNNQLRFDRMYGYPHTPTTEFIITYVDANDKFRFDAVGNVLVIFNETKQTISWALWSPKENVGYIWDNYEYIEKLPDLPIFDFYPIEEVTTDKYDYAYQSSSPSTDSEKQDYIKNHAAAYMAKKRNEWYDKGWFGGYFYLVYAYELFDGTIIKHSNPIAIYGGNEHLLTDELNNPSGTYGGSETHTHLYVVYDGTLYIGCRNVKASSLRFKLMYDVDLSQYKQIIRSINIYISSPTNIDFVENVPSNRTGTQKFSFYPTYYKKDNLPAHAFNRQAGFYLLKRLSIDRMSSYLTEQKVSENLNQLVAQAALPIDNNTHHKLYADANKTYNSRLFLGDIKTTLFNGWSLKHFNHSGSSTQAFIRVILHTSEGVKTVDSELFTIGSKLNFPLIVSYPDTRAVRMDFFTPSSEAMGRFMTINDGFTSKLSIPLQPHPTLNIAYAITPKSNTEQPLMMSKGSYFSNAMWNHSTTGTGNDIIFFTDNTVNDSKRIQLSELNNPLYFPSRNSEYVGSRVLGFAANAIPLSQGQAGQHPMFVFTEQGMYAMSIGADPFIESITALNGEVLTDKRNIVNIGGTTVFKAKEGLKLIEGSQVINLSDSIKLLDNTLLNSSDSGLSNVLSSTILGETDSYISRVPFLEYLTNALLGYDSVNKEVYVINSAYKYSYVLSLKHNYWFKRTLVGRAVISDYPNFFLVTPKEVLQLNSDVPTAYHVFIQTRPIDLEFHGFKKVLRTFLRGVINTVDATINKAGFYLFLSADGLKWKAATGKEVEGVVRDIMLNRTLPSFRYMTLVFSGRITADSFISSFTLDGEDRYSNKLR